MHVADSSRVWRMSVSMDQSVVVDVVNVYCRLTQSLKASSPCGPTCSLCPWRTRSWTSSSRWPRRFCRSFGPHRACPLSALQQARKVGLFFFMIVGEGLSEDRASFKINFYFWLGTWSQMSSLLCGFFSPPPPTHWSCSRRPQVSVCGLRFCCGAAYSRVHMEGQNLDFLKNGSVQDCKIQRKKILVHIRQ